MNNIYKVLDLTGLTKVITMLKSLFPTKTEVTEEITEAVAEVPTTSVEYISDTQTLKITTEISGGNGVEF